MKFFITRSSKSRKDGEVREYGRLDECIEILLNTEDFGKFEPELIISKPDKYSPEKSKECDYEIEIYDTWRE